LAEFQPLIDHCYFILAELGPGEGIEPVARQRELYNGFAELAFTNEVNAPASSPLSRNNLPTCSSATIKSRWA